MTHRQHPYEKASAQPGSSEVAGQHSAFSMDRFKTLARRLLRTSKKDMEIELRRYESERRLERNNDP
jgi:hypothetical protein